MIALIYVLRIALFPFLLGLVIVYLLLPIIKWIEKRLPGQGRWAEGKRISLIVLVALVITGLVGVLSFFIIAAIVDSFSVLLRNAPEYFSTAMSTVREWIEGFRQWLPSQFREQIDVLIQNSAGSAGNFIQDAVMKGITFIPANSTLIFGFISLPLFIFYLLKDSRSLGASFYSALSPGLAKHTRGIISILDKVLGRFVRSQLVLSLAVAIICFLGLLILGIDPGLALGLAIFAGIMDVIPVAGPWIGAIAAIIVALAIAPDKVIWVAIVYLAAQGLENLILRPKIQASYMQIHPAIVLVLLVLGSHIAGFWGLLLSVPLAALVVGLFNYIRDNLNNVETNESPQPAE
jgi:predicted PurR-regulated permease PerM